MTSTKDLDALIKELASKDKDSRWKASEELAEIGGEAVDKLVEVLKSGKTELKVGAAITLGKIGDAPPLIEALRDKHWEVRWAAATSLGNLRAKEAVDDLVNLLKDDSWEVRRAAAISLGKIKDPRAVKPLADALESELMIRFEAARSLIQIGREAVDGLISSLKSADPDVMTKAAEALGLIGDERAVDALSTLLNDSDGGVREAASKALVRIGGKGLDKLFSHLAERCTVEVLKALESIDTDENIEKLISVLGEIITKGDEEARYEAVVVLGKLGDRGIELLVKALEDESELVRKGASMGIILNGERSIPYLENLAKERNNLARDLIRKIRGGE